MGHYILTGRCEERLKELADDSVDSIVTDPPYGIRFMGQAWDGADIVRQSEKRAQYKQKSYGFQRNGPRKTAAESAGTYDLRPSANRVFQEWTEMWATHAFRVLKPGGHLLCFASTRTYHRMTSGIEDAGFEIRDQIGWLFGSGFPKSHNLHGDFEGWGTALKPAWEPVCVARKPLIGTVVANVLAHGTGALNIGACRVGNDAVPINKLEAWSGFGQEKQPDYEQVMSIGRWPANLIHDGSEEVMDAFPDALGQMADVKYDASERKTQNIYGAMKRGHEPSADSANTAGVGFKMKPGARRLDEGSAARFFYCAKANGQDRHEGLENPGTQFEHGTTLRKIENKDPKIGNHHPTVKPTDLMRYLCRLVTPPGGTVLDPFTGSGSTGKAAILEGFNFIGIEQSEEYVQIAEARIAFAVEEVTRENAQHELFA